MLTTELQKCQKLKYDFLGGKAIQKQRVLSCNLILICILLARAARIAMQFYLLVFLCDGVTWLLLDKLREKATWPQVRLTFKRNVEQTTLAERKIWGNERAPSDCKHKPGTIGCDINTEWVVKTGIFCIAVQSSPNQASGPLCLSYDSFTLRWL